MDVSMKPHSELSVYSLSLLKTVQMHYIGIWKVNTFFPQFFYCSESVIKNIVKMFTVSTESVELNSVVLSSNSSVLSDDFCLAGKKIFAV